MAEQDRHTKAERREAKRLRRAEEEAAAAAAAKKAKVRNGLTGVALVVVVAVLVTLAVGNQTPELVNAIRVDQDAVETAMEANGCEELDVVELQERTHLQPATAPAAEALYTNGRPTASGPHYETWGPIVNGVRNEALDERSTTHNLEHGSVIVWFDEEQVDGSDVGDLDDWVKLLNNAGFENQSGSGAGILASPVGEGGIDSGKAVALRAWGVAMDCDSWDQTVANGFVIENFGTRGSAPESPLGPYPEDALEYADSDESDSDESEAPSEAPATDDSEAPSTEPSEAEPSTDPTESSS